MFKLVQEKFLQWYFRDGANHSTHEEHLLVPQKDNLEGTHSFGWETPMSKREIGSLYVVGVLALYFM